MPDYRPWLARISDRAQAMFPRLCEWCALPTPSWDPNGNVGLNEFTRMLQVEFSPRVDTIERVPVEDWETVNERGEMIRKKLGPALRAFRRREAPLQAFLGIHTDVVYGALVLERVPMREEQGRLYAAGAADAKGGIAVMLLALEAFEQSPWSQNLGFEILLNPDEELGSPGSPALLREAARRNHFGLLFEPALPDGGLVSRRKGSGNFTAVFRGRGGHAGRDAATGRNALHAAAEWIVALNAFAARNPGVTVNVGRIDGGGPVNRIADLGVVRFNLRVDTSDQMREVQGFLDHQVTDWKHREGYTVELQGGFASPPKAVEGKTALLLDAALRCGAELNLSLSAGPSGGVCDGNKLAAEGLPNLDTLGVVGGNLHGGDEWMSLSSLAERASLTALLLMKIASGEIPWSAS